MITDFVNNFTDRKMKISVRLSYTQQNELVMRFLTYRNLFFFVFFIFPLVAKSNNTDNIRFVQFTNQQGLPENHILSIIEDYKGFMWIGTRNGLCRYDGYTIKTYTHSSVDSNTINHDFIKKIFEDSKHRLWIANDQGICRYDRQKDKFKRYIDPRFWGQTIFETPQQQVIASTSHGLYVYDEQKDDFIPLSKITKKPLISNNIINDVVRVDSLIWAATNHGIICIDPAGMTRINRIPNRKDFLPLTQTSFSSICTDKYRRLWIGTTARGLYIYDPKHQTLQNYNKTNGLSSNYVRYLLCDDDGNIWAGTELGINIIHPDTKEIKLLKHDISGTSNLNDNAIYALYKDNANNIWVGTYFGGINIHFKGFENFSTYSYGFSNKHLSGKAVRQIIADTDQSLWIATEDGGLNHFDRTNQTFEHYKTTKDKIGLNYYNVHCIVKERKGNLWIGTFSGGINHYNPRTGKTTYYTKENGKIASNMVFCLSEDRNGNIWAGSLGGFLRYSPEEDAFIQVKNPMIHRAFIYCMMEDSDGYIWIGTRRQGLYKYNPQTEHCSRIKLNSQFEDFITYPYEDGQKNIWIGTNNGGLFFYDRYNGEFTNYTTENGLPSNSIMAVIQDNEGNLWISTNAGLCCFDPVHNTKTNYTTNDGLPINQFNYTSAYKSEDGQLFFGSINGMIAFYPQSLKDTKSKLHVEFTDFKIHGQNVPIGKPGSVLKSDITETKEIRLNHKQASSFSFDYTGLNYSHAPKIIYAIRMVGIDPDWQIVGNQRQILFSNLPAGNYRLCIKASYDGIHWDEDSVRCMNIIISPPFWRSWVAYVLYLLFLLLASYIAYRIIRVRIRLRMSLKTEHAAKVQIEELNRQKINFFTNISHDLKTPLTLILAPLKKIVSDKQLPVELKDRLLIILRNAQRMQYLIDELMTFSKIEMKRLKITVRQGDILSFIEEIGNMFSSVAQEGGINFITNIDRMQAKDVWFSPLKLERILYNLLSNALKFTPSGGRIILNAYLQQEADGQIFLKLSVSDTGIGIPSEYLQKIFENYYQVNRNDDKHGSGIGLALTKSLVNIHKGSIRVESKPNKGTTFYVDLNVSETAFKEDEKSPVKLDKEDITSYNYPLLSSSELLQEKLQEPILKEDGKYQILIVEDNKEMNDFIEEIFKNDYMIVKAYNGQEGYEKTIKMMPDIIISDVMMPVMDGFQMTQKLKSDLATSHIPIILLTAKTGEENIIDGFSQGADVYIEKPFSSQSLELQIKNILTTKSNNIQRFKHSPDVNITQIATNPRDEKFMKDLLELVMNNLDNDDFSVSDITDALGISRSLLHIKLKSLANVSVTEFIRNIRMREAREKLLSGMNVSEASFAVGISDPNYFTKCFKRQFGQTPSDFIKSIRKQNKKADE